MLCVRKPIGPSMRRRNGGRFGSGPSIRFWVLNLTDANYFESLATMPDRRRFPEPGAATAVRRLDRLCLLVWVRRHNSPDSGYNNGAIGFLAEPR